MGGKVQGNTEKDLLCAKHYWTFHFPFGKKGKEVTMETAMLHPNQKLVP